MMYWQCKTEQAPGHPNLNIGMSGMSMLLGHRNSIMETLPALQYPQLTPSSDKFGYQSHDTIRIGIL